MADNEKTSDTTISDALERFAESQDGSDFNRQAAEEDTRFARLGDQWPAKVKKQREEEGRPCLTINKLPAFIRSVVNESRQNKPGLKVSPVDGGADEDTAEVIGGLTRSIERGSNAEIAYDTAIDHAVSGGFGFFRVGIDYCHPESFDLECRIDRIPNALMVHWDTNSTEFDASDWEYAFVSDFLTEEQFTQRYPKAKPVSFEGDARDAMANWINNDSVRVAEYWLRTAKQRNLLMLANPNGETRVVREDQLPNLAKAFFQAGNVDMGTSDEKAMVRAFMQMSAFEEKRRREVTYYEVSRRIISGVEVLEEDAWPGTTIPICPVWGEEIYIDGRRHFRSMIRDAKDPQAMFNFWRSASTELVALAPKAPWVGPVGFVPQGQEDKWETANSRAYAYLEYAGPTGPTRQPFAGVPAGVVQESLNASDDIKAVTGIYDSSLGARSNETSGKAILARERQGDVANFHFLDNLSRAIRYAGRVLVEIIPSVYSSRETIRILGQDSKEKVVRLTQQDGGAKGDQGQERLYNLSVGKYDVTVAAGPSFATQREETRETLVEVMSRVPQAGPLIGDILLENMDFVGAEKVAKRLRTLLPEPIQKAEAEEAMPNMPPEAQAILGQAQAQIQTLQQQLQQVQGAAEDKTRETALKEREIKVKEDDAVHRRNLEQQRLNDERSQAIGLTPNGAPPEDKIAVLASSIQGMVQTFAQQNAQTQSIVAAMVQAMSAPKVIIRDEKGRPVGVASQPLG